MANVTKHSWDRSVCLRRLCMIAVGKKKKKKRKTPFSINSMRSPVLLL